MKFIALFVVCVAQEVSRLVVDHDSVIEAVELEVAILPPLLLPSDIMREETSKFGDGCGVLGRGNSRGTRRGPDRRIHGGDYRSERVGSGLEDIGRLLAQSVFVRSW